MCRVVAYTSIRTTMVAVPVIANTDRAGLGVMIRGMGIDCVSERRKK